MATAFSGRLDRFTRTPVSAPYRSTGERIEIRGGLAGAGDLSAVTACGDFLAVASDESCCIQFLVRTSRGHVEVDASRTTVLANGDSEADLEGLAVSGHTLYAVASHAAVRRLPKKARSRPAALRELANVRSHRSRERLYRLQFDADWRNPEIDCMCLTPVIERSALLRRFRAIPSKENGIDIEGIAVHDDTLFVGFRGPVLRDCLVPILALKWNARPRDTALALVRLDGLGIRDMVALPDGFLLLAGPVGDAQGPYRIYFWNGGDALEADMRNPAREPTVLLAQLDCPRGSKPEGMAVLRASARSCDLVLAFDGNAELRRMSIGLGRARRSGVERGRASFAFG